MRQRFLLFLLLANFAFLQAADLQPGVLPSHWITGGPKCMEVPDWQVHEYNEDFYILRESGCTNYEKPFLYLIFGRDRALLEDTGAGASGVHAMVSNVIAKWLRRNNRSSIPLLVVHSHGHGDHTSGDAEFQNEPNTELIQARVDHLQTALHIAAWPSSQGSLDLGDRLIDVLPVPGHQDAAIALYDRKTGILLTGDNLYPGRLYVRDWETFTASTGRLVKFTETHPVTHILGTHIEQSTTPYRDYPIGSMYQPREHALELSRAHLLELYDALTRHSDQASRIALRDFTIFPMTPEAQAEMRKLYEETQARERKAQWDNKP